MTLVRDSVFNMDAVDINARENLLFSKFKKKSTLYVYSRVFLILVSTCVVHGESLALVDPLYMDAVKSDVIALLFLLCSHYP